MKTKHLLFILICTSTWSYSQQRFSVNKENKRVMYTYIACLLIASTFCPTQTLSQTPKQSTSLPPLINATNSTLIT